MCSPQWVCELLVYVELWNSFRLLLFCFVSLRFFTFLVDVFSVITSTYKVWLNRCVINMLDLYMLLCETRGVYCVRVSVPWNFFQFIWVCRFVCFCCRCVSFPHIFSYVSVCIAVWHCRRLCTYVYSHTHTYMRNVQCCCYFLTLQHSTTLDYQEWIGEWVNEWVNVYMWRKQITINTYQCVWLHTHM